jgi:hypothetical protein
MLWVAMRQINLNEFEKENWDEMIPFMTNQMIEVESVFKRQIKDIKNKLIVEK